MADLIDICAHRFAHGCDRIDERNLHGKKCIGCVLDEFRTLGAGYENRGGDRGAVGLRDGVTAFVISAASQRSVDLAENISTSVVVATYDNAIRKEEIGDGGTFAQEFRIGGNVERAGVSAVAQNDLANPFAGVNRDSALLDDNLVVIDAAGDFA